jgi:NAD(P)-dependent dehydrogenase (short-subunit alcohol dehydrogenase family)
MSDGRRKVVVVGAGSGIDAAIAARWITGQDIQDAGFINSMIAGAPINSEDIAPTSAGIPIL